MASLCVVLALSLKPCSAVRLGDESYGLNTTGAFYVFADSAIQVVDPTSLTIVKNITQDQNGKPLTNSAGASITWNDVVYIQGANTSVAYIYANEGDIYGSGASAYSYVTVVDVRHVTIIPSHSEAMRIVVDRVQVQPRPVHIYTVQQTQQVWSHSDATGNFSIISVSKAGSLNSTIPSYASIPGHGKLLVDDA
ncbi:hypothetical protein WJX84_006832, partial [Apatococcus fuscideae]